MKQKSGFVPKSFAIVGAGCVGSIVAAFLAKGGYEVTLCDVFPDLLKRATDPGILIEGAENLQQKVTRTTTSIDELAKYKPDVIFIMVKANALPLISSAIKEFYREGMYVVSWQNGIDTELVLADALGKKAVMRAVVNYGCGLVEPGHVTMAFHHPPHFMQELDPSSRDATVAIAAALSKAGLATERVDDIASKVWYKGILNSCMNPVCAVTGYTMSQAMGDPIVFQVVDNLVKECVRVARANEINLGWNFYREAINYMSTAGNHKPSMLIDIENKRRTEVDFMNGKFIEYGQRAGIETPYNSTIRSLVKALEPK
jgi:2-dehydropantoate 2-reductase